MSGTAVQGLLSKFPCQDYRGAKAGAGLEAKFEMSNDRPTCESMSIEEATVSTMWEIAVFAEGLGRRRLVRATGGVHPYASS
jgi:hypothetical protein